MKKVLKKTFAVLLMLALIVLAVWVSRHPQEKKVRELSILLCDSTVRRYVSTEELRHLLSKQGLIPVGKLEDEISCHAIEECLLTHDMVRSAECHKSPFGKVYVHIEQRQPMLLVNGMDGCYYVDTDAKPMPIRSSIDADVPLFKGSISKRDATEEYYEFAQWLTKDRYWKERIKEIQVRSPRDIVLKQEDLSAKIIMGDLTNYQQKLNKLEKLYTKGFHKIGYKSYKELDLRFAGQVIGRN